ncbi:MAG: 2-hydroxyacid dehydrogenase [Planctomycetia bacterium]|nr:2-hydroxyacid dehydrogenase [Planctomycetia bacterium]
MRIAVFSTKPYDREFLTIANDAHLHELHFLEPRLNRETAPLAHGFPAVCAFVNDVLDAETLTVLQAGGTRVIALRSAGFNHVHLPTAAKLGLKVMRVPAYSPYAVAEHAVGLILTLTRRLHKAYVRVREGNFSLDGLLGFDLHGRTVGVVGTGKIGAIVARIMHGFGCRLLCHDRVQNPECVALGAKYVPLDELLAGADIITLHCPLMPETKHMISAAALAKMKRGAMLINTSRGALVETKAVIDALKHGQLGSLGLDVYEEEADLFFEDLSRQVIQDDVFSRLLTFPNVMITAHQAFFTCEALDAISRQTIANVTAFERGEPLVNEVSAPAS